MQTRQAGKGALFWVLALAGSAVALFFGSAIFTGIMESRENEAVRQKAKALTSTESLLSIMLAEMRRVKGRPVLCWYIGAIGYRLAEARDLKIPMSHAVDLANEEYLVEDLAKAGFNARHVITGIALQVYDSPLPPFKTLEVQSQSCARAPR